MTEEILHQLIASGETGTVEFKSSATRPIEVAVRMCGMANNRAGGIIIFGIEDASRAIVGIRNPSLTNDVVFRAARMIKPAVPLGETSVQTWTLDGATLLTVEIPSNSGTLYQYDGACYVRRGTNTVPLSVEEIGAHLNAYEPSRWESGVTPHTTIADLDPEALEGYLAARSSEGRIRQRSSSNAEVLLGLHAAARDTQIGDIRPVKSSASSTLTRREFAPTLTARTSSEPCPS